MTFAYPENVSGYLSLTQYANTATGGFLGTFILIATIAVIFFIARKSGYSDEQALTYAFFIGSISAIFFLIWDITTWYVTTFILVTAGLYGVTTFWKRSRED